MTFKEQLRDSVIHMLPIIVLVIIISSCKTTSKCDAYSKDDIHKQHIEYQNKYCSVEIIK